MWLKGNGGRSYRDVYFRRFVARGVCDEFLILFVCEELFYIIYLKVLLCVFLLCVFFLW